MATANTDTGLGLTQFLSKSTSGAPAPAVGEKPSQPASVAETKPEVKTEAKTEAKVETKPEKVAEAPKVAEPAKETKTEEKVAAPAKDEKKDEKKEESSPTFDWEADANPHKKRASDLEKQVRDTRNWATQVNQEKVELQRQLEIINKKLDGTYDPEKDIPAPPPVEAITTAAVIKDRAQSSLESAVEWATKNGKDREWVEKQIEHFDSTLGLDPLVQLRVLKSRSPIMEAFSIMQEEAAKRKWGNNLGEMERNIRADEAKKFETKLEEMVSKRIEERLKNLDKQPTGIREAREATTDSTSNGWRPKSLDEVLRR